MNMLTPIQQIENHADYSLTAWQTEEQTEIIEKLYALYMEFGDGMGRNRLFINQEDEAEASLFNYFMRATSDGCLGQAINHVVEVAAYARELLKNTEEEHETE